MFVKNLLGEFPWESIGIVELETNLTVQNRLMRILQTGDFVKSSIPCASVEANRSSSTRITRLI